MFPYHAYGVGKARMEEAQTRAEVARARRPAPISSRRLRWIELFSLRRRRSESGAIALRSPAE